MFNGQKKRFACRILILHISYTHYENYSPTDNTHCFLTDDIECTISIQQYRQDTGLYQRRFYGLFNDSRYTVKLQE